MNHEKRLQHLYNHMDKVFKGFVPTLIVSTKNLLKNLYYETLSSNIPNLDKERLLKLTKTNVYIYDIYLPSKVANYSPSEMADIFLHKIHHHDNLIDYIRDNLDYLKTDFEILENMDDPSKFYTSKSLMAFIWFFPPSRLFINDNLCLHCLLNRYLQIDNQHTLLLKERESIPGTYDLLIIENQYLALFI
jgi:hypothetical protein